MAESEQEDAPSGTTGIPHQSGLYTWLLDEVRARFGEAGAALITASYPHGNQRYSWLLDEVARNFGQAGAAVRQEFIRRRKAIAARQRLLERMRDLELHRRLLTEALAREDHGSAAYHRHAADRASRYIEIGLTQEGITPPPHMTIARVVPPAALVEDRRYPTALPLAVRDWYHYSRVHGHCILCALCALCREDRAPGHCMRSVPVRTVLGELRRGAVRISDEGYVLIDLPPTNDDLWYPREEHEMEE